MWGSYAERNLRYSGRGLGTRFCIFLRVYLTEANSVPAIRCTLTLYVKITILVSAIVLTTCACGPSQRPVIDYGYEVVHTYPHDPAAFTEGLFYLDGFLYESTGLEGQSSVRKVRLETGEIVQKHDLPAEHFGEGIVNWKKHLIQLTYKTSWDLFTISPALELSASSNTRAKVGR